MLDHFGRNEMSPAGNPSRGLMPSSSYDIHCPLMGGDRKVFNYLSSSCRSRQAARGCFERTCSRFVVKPLVRQHRQQTPPPSPPKEAKPANPVNPARRCAARPIINKADKAPSRPVFDPTVFRHRGGIEVTLVIPDNQSHLYQVLANAAKRHNRSLSEEILARLNKRLKR